MKFSINKSDNNTSARTGTIDTDHGSIQTPVFMPVGTIGAVKTFSPHELEGLGSEIILGNTYHLYLRPGTEIIKKAGGIHEFSNWSRPLLTDSGGFQVFSLARLNKINNNGVEFQSHLDGSYHSLTPEISMEIQRSLGSDIIMAFDQCPPASADHKEISEAVERTTRWFKRCKGYLKDHPSLYNYSQTLFPIIQGGVDHELRQMSIETLADDADCGIAIGGLAVGEEKNAMFDTIEYCEALLPKDQPRYLMGVGKPTDIVKAVCRGVDMFDCVMPTRNGRNGQIFTSSGTININNEKYKNDHSLIDESSEHAFGRMFTKSYLRHLFNVKEILGLRIASTLNLSFYFSLMKMIKQTINSRDFEKWSSGWLSEMKTKKGM